MEIVRGAEFDKRKDKDYREAVQPPRTASKVHNFALESLAKEIEHRLLMMDAHE
jgi:hypothetical protein